MCSTSPSEGGPGGAIGRGTRFLPQPTPAALDDARAAGAHAIAAPLLAIPRGGAGALAARGLTHVHAVIAGPDARAHDFVRRAPGEHDELALRLAEARGHGLAILASTPLHRSSYRVLGAIGDTVVARGAVAWSIGVVDPGDASPGDPWPDVPRLALALPFALHAIERARAAGILAHVRGAPLCLLGPLAERALPSPPRSHAEPCERCPARPACPGVAAPYLARFGARELAPRGDAPRPAPSVLSALLARAEDA